VLSTGEVSGDAMVEELVSALRSRCGDGLRLRVLTSAPIAGVSDDEVLAEAPESEQVIARGGVRVWRKALEDALEVIHREPPDLFIGVSHHAFNFVLAAEIRAARGSKTKTMMVAPPETWAWEPRWPLPTVGPLLRALAPKRSLPFVLGAQLDRGTTTIELFDGIACLLRRGAEEYRRLASRHRLTRIVAEVGHPFRRYVDEGLRRELHDSGQAFRARLQVRPQDSLLGIFPGSRREEVETLLPTMIDAIVRLRERRTDLRLLISAASEHRRHQIKEVIARHPERERLADATIETERADVVLTASDFGLLCSGTVTLQAACLALPSVLAFDRSRLQTLVLPVLARRKTIVVDGVETPVPFALPSAVLGERVFPEFVFSECKARNIFEGIDRLMDEPDVNDSIGRRRERLLEQLQPRPSDRLTGTTPMRRAAEMGLRLLE
jgi:lipid A disaccharide synthetase